MKQKIETPQIPFPAEPTVESRTEKQLTESIREKRNKNLKLDSEEEAFVTKQLQEDREDRTKIYRQ